jgi:uncharacterized protein (TIGR03435 family)
MNLTMKIMSSVLISAVMFIPLSNAQAPAQQKPAFEVASIKPNAAGPGGGPARVTSDSRRFVGSNATLRTVLLFAYRPQTGRTLRYGDITGVPSWADNEHFDIEAKVNPGIDATPEQMRLMVQSLLADRFQLKVRWETREMPTYNLVAAKNGIKIKPSQDQSPITIDIAPANQASPPRGTPRTIAKPSPSGIALSLSGEALPIDTLVNTLQSYAGRPLFDKTGLGGMFDVKLEFFMEASGGNPGATAPDPSGPTFATAIEDQLGLKLESSRSPVEILIVDSVQRPSEN